MPVEGDSETCTFFLVPQYTGVLRLNLEVYAGEVYLTSRILKTQGETSDRECTTRSRMLLSVPLIVTGYQHSESRPSERIITGPQPEVTINIGGVNITGGQGRISIGGDVVGRDKATTFEQRGQQVDSQITAQVSGTNNATTSIGGDRNRS